MKNYLILTIACIAVMTLSGDIIDGLAAGTRIWFLLTMTASMFIIFIAERYKTRISDLIVLLEASFILYVAWAYIEWEFGEQAQRIGWTTRIYWFAYENYDFIVDVVTMLEILILALGLPFRGNRLQTKLQGAMGAGASRIEGGYTYVYNGFFNRIKRSNCNSVD